MSLRRYGPFWLVLMVLALSPIEVRAEVTDLAVPSLGVTVSDQSITFSAATFDAPGLLGTMEPGNGIQLEVSTGTLSLATTEGLIFVIGDGIDDVSITFAGDDASTEAALDGLVYSPSEGFAGGAVITMTLVGTPTLEASWRVAVNAPFDWNAARAAILGGFNIIHSGVQPGHMVAFGPTAYDAVRYPGANGLGTLIGYASWGAGRVVAVPDHQMLDMDSYGYLSGTFYKNSLAWLTGSEELSIKIVTIHQGTADWLVGEGYTDVTVVGDAGLAAALGAADVLVPGWLGSDVTDQNLEAIGDFVRGGGGLFIADYGVGYQWWWEKPTYQAPGNLLLREPGIGFTSGYMQFTAGITMTKTASEQVNADVLLSMLEDTSPYTADDLTLGLNLLKRIYEALPPGDPLAKRLDAAIEGQMQELSPTPQTPISGFWEQALLSRESTILEETPLDEIEKHRTADDVFGEVPDDAPRVTAVVMVDPAVTRWHSTGLYLAPGDLVTVEVGPEVTGEGFQIQVSGHVDDISGKDSWLRMPRVERTFELDSALIQVASPFGGALYVNVGTTSTELAPFEVTFSNVVEAPLFVLDETTDAEWIGGLRDLPAPYAEFVSGHLSFSLPSSMIRELDGAEAVAAFWDEVVALQDSLGMLGDMRTNAERINIDVQVSWGYLHAGYPTQGPLAAGPEIVNLDQLLLAGSWGWFHELGHEAQRRPDKSWGWDNVYTFDDSVEATVNIFTSTVYDVMEIPTRGGWSWTGPRPQVMQKALDGLGEGGAFSSLDVGFKLAMFLQLRDGWGWGAFQALFAGYNSTDPADLPIGDQEERDEFLVRFSEVVGHDMGPFLGDRWGLAFSDDARAEVAALPDWLPALGGIEGQFIVPVKTVKTFDLAGDALSFDGVATVTDVTQPDPGILTPNEDGSWTYQPEPGFQGPDSFQYTVVSSTGHGVTSIVDLDVTSHGVLMERWDDIPGSELSELTTHPDYPEAPHATTVLKTFDAPVDIGSNFGARLRAFLLPDITGDYTFWIASDDNGELWLSPGQDPDDAALIASVPSWSGPKQWDLHDEQQSVSITLEAGQVYYIEALYKEGGGSDHLAVAWALTGLEAEAIDGADLRIFRLDNTAPIAVPDSAETTVGAPVSIDIMANDTDIDGDPLYVLEWVTSPGAEVALGDDGTLLYSPEADFSGQDTFTYTIGDGYGGAATAMVTVSIFYNCDVLLCYDGNPCTDEFCDPDIGCVVTENSLPCTDDNPCTNIDVCVGGTCQAGVPVVCDDGNFCTFDTCDPATGCVFSESALPCDDDNPCTEDACEPAEGCVYEPNTLPCDDGNACTFWGVCAGGACQAGDPVVCDDVNPCTDDGCDPITGCVFSDNTLPCDDEDACTDDDACKNGDCAPGAPVDCDDGDPCTDDGCQPEAGCSHTPVDGCCATDLGCAPGEACVDLTCESVHCTGCVEDADCGNGGLCVEMNSGDYCLVPCDGDCAEGMSCIEGDVPVCWPDEGDCVCEPGAGETCDGDQLVDLDSCGEPGEILEVCERGCVEDIGCCPEGTEAIEGECQPDVIGEDLVTEPDVVTELDIEEIHETWEPDAEPSDLESGDNAGPAADTPIAAPDVPTGGSDGDQPGLDGAEPGDDLSPSVHGSKRGGCTSSPTAAPTWPLLLLLVGILFAIRYPKKA